MLTACFEPTVGKWVFQRTLTLEETLEELVRGLRIGERERSERGGGAGGRSSEEYIVGRKEKGGGLLPPPLLHLLQALTISGVTWDADWKIYFILPPLQITKQKR